MINLKSKATGKSIKLITDIKDVTPEVLTRLTGSFNLPKNRIIVALCQKVNVFDIASSIRSNNKDQTVMVYPLLAKASKEDLDLINGNIGDVLTVNRTAIELGSHLIINTMANFKNVSGFFHNDRDLCARIVKGEEPALLKNGVAGTVGMINDRVQSIYMIEFKVINATDVVASKAVADKTDDPFKGA